MYPDHTIPPRHIKGDYAPTKMGEGLLIFGLGAGLIGFGVVMALRAYTIFIYPTWRNVPLLHFPNQFFQHWLAAPLPFIFICFLIMLAGAAGLAGAAWMGVLTARPWGGESGVRWLSGPVLQYFPPPLKKGGDVGIKISDNIFLSDRDQCRHMLAGGATGSGKTTTLYPIIKQAVARGDRCIIWDEKAGFVETLLSLIILSPWDRRAWRWDISKDMVEKASIQDFAVHVCPPPQNGDKVWANAAQAIVVACCIKLANEKKEWFLSDLRTQILDVAGDLQRLQGVVQQFYPEAGGIVVDIKSKALSSVVFQLSSSLQSILMIGEFDAELAKLERKSLSLKSYLRKGVTNAPPIVLPGHPTSQGLSTTFCGALIHYVSTNLAGRSETTPDRDGVWLFLDEFKQLGKQDGVIRLLEVGRSKSVRIVLGIQGPEQIRQIYGHEDILKTILNNTLIKFHSQYLDHSAAEWASESLGKTHWKVRRITQNNQQVGVGGGGSVVFQDVESSLFEPDDFRTKLGPFPKQKVVKSILAGGLFPDPVLVVHPFLTDKKLRVARETIRILVAPTLQIIDPLPTPKPTPAPAAVAALTPTPAPVPVALAPTPLPAVRQAEPATSPADPGCWGVKVEEQKQEEEEKENIGVEVAGSGLTDAATDLVAPGAGVLIDVVTEIIDSNQQNQPGASAPAMPQPPAKKRLFKKKVEIEEEMEAE